jgi:RND family efflux transporter MFP subunit
MSQTQEPNTQSSAPEASIPEQRPIPARFGVVLIVVVAVVALGLGLAGYLSRLAHARALKQTTTELAAPTVTVTPPKPGAPVSSFMLPGNVQAFTDAPIYARTSGYLSRWFFDIGSHVKKGALLAVISTPEVDQQLRQAEADLAQAQANATQARIQAERYTGLVASNAVSRQDTDSFVNQAAATQAQVRSAQANLGRLRQMQAFQKIYAPFDGVVTARTVDTGQLIDAGGAKELFRLQAIQTLRVYSNIPQIYAAGVKVGSKIDLTFAEHAGKTYQGTLVRTADAIDPVSRTLLVEIDVDNRSGELMPGSLAQVHFKTTTAGSSLVIPATALIFRSEGLRVGVLGPGSVARLVPVVMGEDDGATVQIVTGLTPTDQVIQDPPDSLIDKQAVRPVPASQQPLAGGK